MTIYEKPSGIIVRIDMGGGNGMAVFIDRPDNGFGLTTVKLFKTIEGHACGDESIFSFATLQDAATFVNALHKAETFSASVTDYGKYEGPCL